MCVCVKVLTFDKISMSGGKRQIKELIREEVGREQRCSGGEECVEKDGNIWQRRRRSDGEPCRGVIRSIKGDDSSWWQTVWTCC